MVFLNLSSPERKKKILKTFVPRRVLKFYQKINMLDFRVGRIEEEMKNKWILDKLPETKNQKEMLMRKEFKIFSQTGEDGIINYLFEKIGMKNKKFVEIGIEDGRECNTANLSLNFGWKGILIEADKEYAKKANRYYSNFPVKVLNEFVTRENINRILERNQMRGEIDLLSIDVDGNDYWIWEAVEVINPRVVIVEYNSILGNRPITVRYSPKFERFKAHSSGYYYGTSLAALCKLAEKKGYILVGCNSFGFNAFFVRKNDASKKFYALSPEEADPNPNGINECAKRLNIIKDMPFEIIK